MTKSNDEAQPPVPKPSKFQRSILNSRIPATPIIQKRAVQASGTLNPHLRRPPSSATHAPIQLLKSFTLLELLVVIAIVAVLAALAVPVYQRVTAASRSTACVSNLRQLGLGLSTYLADHEQTMPTLGAARESRREEKPAIDTVLDRYVPAPAVFACPADDQDLAATTGTSYYWNSALNGQRAVALNFLGVEQNSRIPVLVDKAAFHPHEANKVNMLYADGHATRDLTFVVAQ